MQCNTHELEYVHTRSLYIIYVHVIYIYTLGMTIATVAVDKWVERRGEGEGSRSRRCNRKIKRTLTKIQKNVEKANGPICT